MDNLICAHVNTTKSPFGIDIKARYYLQRSMTECLINALARSHLKDTNVLVSPHAQTCVHLAGISNCRQLRPCSLQVLSFRAFGAGFS